MQAAWEKLHTGCWKDVEPAWRDAYALACLLRALVRLSWLHVSPPAVSEARCSRAPAQSLPSSSDRAPQPEKLKQTGEQVDIIGNAANTEAQPAAIDTPAAQVLTSRQESSSEPPYWATAERRRGNGERADISSDQHAGVHGRASATAADGAVQEAMRELDLGIMMGGHTYQESLHAAMTIAQKALVEGSEAAKAGSSQLTPVRDVKISGEQIEQSQTEHGRKRKRRMHEEGSGDGPGSEAGKEIDCSAAPRVDHASRAIAAWALAEHSKDDLSTLQQQLPPGVPNPIPPF